MQMQNNFQCEWPLRKVCVVIFTCFRPYKINKTIKKSLHTLEFVFLLHEVKMTALYKKMWCTCIHRVIIPWISSSQVGPGFGKKGTWISSLFSSCLILMKKSVLWHCGLKVQCLAPTPKFLWSLSSSLNSIAKLQPMTRLITLDPVDLYILDMSCHSEHGMSHPDP